MDTLPRFVTSSWQRCKGDHHLSRHALKPNTRLLDSEASLRRRRIEEVLARNPSQMQRLRALAREADHCFMVTDTDGVVVEQYSEGSSARNLERGGLTLGSEWRESLAGTNAIAMALIERRTLTVAGDAHYFKSLTAFSCTASPILDHKDQVLGTLDLSGLDNLGSDDQVYARHFLSLIAAEIQANLFQNHHRDHLLVTLSDAPNSFAHHINALLAIDGDGAILGITRRASAILGEGKPDQILGKRVDDVIGASVDDLMALSGRQTQVELTRSRYCFARPTAPVKRAVASSPRGKQRPHARAAGNMPSLDRLAGSDAVMLQNVKLCRRILDRNIPIILHGETGVGKDAFAKALHAESARHSQPFVVVNCAAMPASLLDSELFGYTPGTFTGGLKGGKIGKIAAGNHGTLFLDEIGDMPLDLQGRLLRVLAEGEVTPLGSVDPIPVEINIICATHRDLVHQVETGAFREDLYYRLNGAKIAVPALRSRSDLEDIVFDILATEATPPPRVSPEALGRLLAYRWPGNIRQLINTIRFAAACSDGDEIGLADLPAEVGDPEAGAIPVAIAPPRRLVSISSLSQSKEETERRRILETLQGVNWCVSEAARRLQISRATMHRKIKDHRIVRPNPS